LSGQPLHLHLRASPVLTVLTSGMHGAAAAVLWFILPPLAGAAAVLLVLLLGALSVSQRTLLWAGDAPAVLALGRDGSLVVQLRGGGKWKGTPAERRYVTRWLVVLELARPRLASRTLLVARDMLASEEFRHLRLWALWRALPDESSVASA
jgi:hypothetical protein